MLSGRKTPLQVGHTYAPCLFTFISAPHFGQIIFGNFDLPVHCWVLPVNISFQASARARADTTQNVRKDNAREHPPFDPSLARMCQWASSKFNDMFTIVVTVPHAGCLNVLDMLSHGVGNAFVELFVKYITHQVGRFGC